MEEEKVQRLRRYEFTLIVVGYGFGPDEAWQDACECHEIEGPMPERYTYTEEGDE